MDVDQMQGNSSGTMDLSLPQIDENAALDNKDPKESIIEMLDKLETHVERFRKEAAKLEEEKDRILASLDSLRHTDSLKNFNENERDDILGYLERISGRLVTVEVGVRTQRDETQEEALSQINHFIDSLIVCLRTDPEGTRVRCQSFVNACSSHFTDGITDNNFQSALLACALDDQKRVKRRLHGLLNYIDKLQMDINDL